VILSKKSKPKLVICLSRFPYPLEKGDKLRAFFQIRDLSESFNVFLICTTDVKVSQSSIDKLLPYCKEIHVFELNKVTILINLFIGLFSNYPFQIHYFTQFRIKSKINKLLNKIQPNHIFCQLVRPAEYVKNYHFCPKTIDIMDALSVGMERRSNVSNWALKLIFKEESARLKKYEQRIINYFENILIISEQDKKFIIHPRQNEIKVVPNGVNELFLETKSHSSNLKIDLLFTGNMSYFPNIEAALYISKHLLPYIIKKELVVNICGANPSKQLTSIQNKHFIVTGWVDNIQEYYENANVFIAPIFSGSGMQNKILEAMAIGIPCVTTTLANNAILAENNHEILIANNPEEFIFQMERLLSDKILYQHISENAKEFVKKNYEWKSINQKLAKILEG
jgi:polysaccharide biosynthesis protein PslH